MIYAESSPKFRQYLMQGCAHVELHFDKGGPAASYVTERILRKWRSGEVPAFVVDQPGQAWYLGCFAATPEQCQKNGPHLCVVVCKQRVRSGSKTLHECSPILCVPTIFTSRFAHLSDLVTDVKSDVAVHTALNQTVVCEHNAIAGLDRERASALHRCHSCAVLALASVVENCSNPLFNLSKSSVASAV